MAATPWPRLWRPQSVAFVLTVAVAVAAGSRAQPPATVAEAESSLQAEADRLIAKSLSSIKASAKSALRARQSQLQDEVYAAQLEQKDIMKDINGPSKASLDQAKEAMASAKSEAAMRAKAAAANAARAVEAEAEQLHTNLIHKAAALQSEGEIKKAQALWAQNESHVAVSQAQQWRSQWPKNEAQNALQSSAVATQLSTMMFNMAKDTVQRDDLINQVAIQTMGVITQASDHAGRAAAIALQAVDQAAQNSLRLQTIQAIVQRAQESTSAATMAAGAQAMRQ